MSENWTDCISESKLRYTDEFFCNMETDFQIDQSFHESIGTGTDGIG